MAPTHTHLASLAPQLASTNYSALSGARKVEREVRTNLVPVFDRGTKLEFSDRSHPELRI